MVRYLRRRLGDDAAEDATVDVFVRATRTRSADHESYGSTRSWLYALATSAISERWRTERSRLEALEWLARQPPVPHPALDQLRRLDPRIATALRSLPAIDRETLLLVAWGELDNVDVARTLGIPLDTIQARLAAVADRVVRAAPARSADPANARRRIGHTPQVKTLAELIAVLADNADLGLDHVRQPRIESAVNHRVAPPAARPRAQAAGPQPVGA